MTDNTTLLPLVEKFFENDLNAAAGVLESMSEEEAASALKSLPIPLAVRVVKVLQISYAAELLKDADDQFLIEMTSLLDPQFLASIMMRLPQEARERMSQHISEKLKEQIREHLDYPEDSIGRTMTTDFVALKKHNRVEEAIEKIRSLAKKNTRHPMFMLLMRKIASSGC
jgi:magnesium transporter